jgi:hypothetical protein
MCTVMGKLTHRLTSCAKLFTMAAIASAKSVLGMLSGTCGTGKARAGCHGTALGFRLVNPGRASQHLAGLSTGIACQGTGGGGGPTEASECFVLLSSLQKPGAEGKLVCDRGVLSGVLGISSKLQVSNLSVVASEHPSVGTWLSGLKDVSTNGMAALRDGSFVEDSKLSSGSLRIGEEWERLCAP